MKLLNEQDRKKNQFLAGILDENPFLLNEAKINVNGIDKLIALFALNLEYWEAEYYMRGVFGKGLSKNILGSKPGDIRGGSKVKFSSKIHKEIAEEIARNEEAHVKYYQGILGKDKIDCPAIDFETGFNMAAKAAGLGDTFDPFENEVNFFLGGMLFEDVGVTVYNGAIPLISNKDFLQKVSGVLAVESHHMGLIRGMINMFGKKAIKAGNAISDARKSINGRFEQGVTLDGKVNFVPADKDATAFVRTPKDVMSIITLKKGGREGGFFPEGLNGNLKNLIG